MCRPSGVKRAHNACQRRWRQKVATYTNR